MRALRQTCLFINSVENNVKNAKVKQTMIKQDSRRRRLENVQNRKEYNRIGNRKE